MEKRLLRFWEWLHEGRCFIKDQHGKIRPLYPNSLQERIFAQMLKQTREGQPVRIIILKDRKPGCSTFVQSLFYFLTKFTDHWFSQVVAHNRDDTANIFEISKRIKAHDEEPPAPNTTTKTELAWERHDSRFLTRTAGGEYVASGATINALHLSELPKWPGDKQVVSAQLASLLNAVPLVPESVIIIESTAEMNDATREFESRWHDAVKGQSPYVPVFHAWWENPSKRTRVRGSIEPLEHHEQILREKYGCDDEQIQWYRDKLRECRGDLQIMRQEHPSSPEEAFQHASGKIYAMLDRKIHDRRIPVEKLLFDGYEFYRGIDWGGSNPFVCLWVAYCPTQDQQGYFTIDVDACPNTWRQLTQYHYDDSGLPAKKDDDACDALRYVITHFGLYAGHVHVYREMFLTRSAQHGLSDLDHARDIMAYNDGREVVGTVADPSQPKTINLVNNIGLAVTPYERSGGMVRDVRDGIAHLKALMRGTIPLVHVAEPPPLVSRVQDLIESSEIDFSVADSELLVALDNVKEEPAARGDLFEPMT